MKLDAATAPRAQVQPTLPRLRWRLLVLAAAAMIGATAPWWAEVSTLRLCVEFFTLLAIAQMWNLLAGYGGLVSVGQQAFVGVGAYALFAVSNQLGLNPFASTLGAALIAALVAAMFTPLLFRLRGAQFAIGTWVLAEMLRIGANNLEWLGAGAGLNLEMIRDIDRWMRAAGAYWLALALAVLVIGLMIAFIHSTHGLALAAVRDNEDAAASLGVNAERLKRALFVIAAGVTGACGGVAYINVLQVSPDAAFSLNWTAYAIFIVVIGGIGTIEGPIVGALLFFALRETLADYGTWYLVSLGILAVITMMFLPNGLWGACSKRFGWSILFVRRSAVFANDFRRPLARLSVPNERARKR